MGQVCNFWLSNDGWHHYRPFIGEAVGWTQIRRHILFVHFSRIIAVNWVSRLFASILQLVDLLLLFHLLVHEIGRQLILFVVRLHYWQVPLNTHVHSISCDCIQIDSRLILRSLVTRTAELRWGSTLFPLISVCLSFVTLQNIDLGWSFSWRLNIWTSRFLLAFLLLLPHLPIVRFAQARTTLSRLVDHVIRFGELFGVICKLGFLHSTTWGTLFSCWRLLTLWNLRGLSFCNLSNFRGLLSLRLWTGLLLYHLNYFALSLVVSWRRRALLAWRRAATAVWPKNALFLQRPHLVLKKHLFAFCSRTRRRLILLATLILFGSLIISTGCCYSYMFLL